MYILTQKAVWVRIRVGLTKEGGKGAQQEFTEQKEMERTQKKDCGMRKGKKDEYFALGKLFITYILLLFIH